MGYTPFSKNEFEFVNFDNKNDMDIALIVFLVILSICPAIILMALLHGMLVKLCNYIVSMYQDRQQGEQPSCPSEPNYSDDNILAFQDLLLKKYNVRVGLTNRSHMLLEAAEVVAWNAQNAVRFNRDCGIEYISPDQYYKDVKEEYEARGKLSNRTQCQISQDPVYQGLVTLYNDIVPPRIEEIV